MRPQRHFLLGNHMTLGEIWRRQQKGVKHICMLDDQGQENKE